VDLSDLFDWLAWTSMACSESDELKGVVLCCPCSAW
jgi:hypothetical protein